MSRFFRTSAFAFVTAASLASSVQSAAAWSCYAKSKIGDGWGYSSSLATAKADARLQCMLHTPRAMSCRVMYCRKS